MVVWIVLAALGWLGLLLESSKSASLREEIRRLKYASAGKDNFIHDLKLIIEELKDRLGEEYNEEDLDEDLYNMS